MDNQDNFTKPRVRGSKKLLSSCIWVCFVEGACLEGGVQRKPSMEAEIPFWGPIPDFHTPIKHGSVLELGNLKKVYTFPPINTEPDRGSL